MLRVLDCPELQKPITGCRDSQRFGLPIKGVHGRDGVAIQGIVIHCVENVEEGCTVGGKLHASDSGIRTSYHYSINRNGGLYQDVDDADIAWGLTPSVVLGTTTVNYECGLMPSFVSVPGKPADQYLLHIAVESAKNRVAFEMTGDCGCGAGLLAKQFGKEVAEKLVHLLAWLASSYNITLDENHINFRHHIDLCDREECGCPPCISELLCAVSGYCEAVNNPTPTSFVEGQLVRVFGDDATGQQAVEGLSNLVLRALRVKTGVLQVQNADGTWTNVPIVP